MADDIRLVIGVEQSGLLKAITNTESLEKKVKKLSDAYNRGDATVGRYNRAIAKLAKSSKQSTDELQRYGKALRDDEKATKKATAETKAFTLARKQATEEDRRRTDTLRKSQAETKKLAAEVDRLSSKYKPLYAASKQYEKSLDEINRAHQVGAINTKQHSAAIESLNSDYQKFTSGTAGWDNQFVQGSNRAGKSMNKFGMYAQQVGYQVGDFFVQVQSGQSALVAFGQQGTQLAGLLPGVLGAVVGIGLAVGTMLLRSFMDASGEAQTLEEAISGAEEALDDFKDSVRGSDDLKDQFGSMATYMTKVADESARFAENMLAANISGAMDKIGIESGFFKQLWDMATDTSGGVYKGEETQARRSAGQNLDKLGLSEELTVDEMGAYEGLIRAFSNRKDFKAAIHYLTSLKNKALEGLSDTQQQDMSASGKAFISAISDQMRILGEFVKAQEDAAAAPGIAEDKRQQKFQGKMDDITSQTRLLPHDQGTDAYDTEVHAQQIAAYNAEQDALVKLGDLEASKARILKDANLILQNKLLAQQKLVRLEEAEEVVRKAAVKRAGEQLKIRRANEKQRDASIKRQLADAIKQLEVDRKIAAKEAETAKQVAYTVRLGKERAKLSEIELAGNKESTEYRNQEVLLASMASVEASRRLGYSEETTATMEAQAIAQVTVTNQIADAATEAALLAKGLQEAETAMNSLDSVGDGISKSLAVALAKVKALEAGGTGKIAGIIEGKRQDIENKAAAAFAGGKLHPADILASTSQSYDDLDKYEAALIRIQELEGRNKPTKEVKSNAYEKLTLELDRRKELLSMSESQAEVTRNLWSLEDALGKARANYSEVDLKAIIARQTALEKSEDLAKKAAEQQKALADTIETSMGDAFMAMSDGTKSVSDAFRTMAAEIVRHLYKVYVMQVAIAAIKTFAGGLFAADGAVLSGGSEVKAYADGGVVGGPTTFPMAGGKTGLMGEAGPEAIMPLKRGANGKLGVQAEGGSGDIYVTNNYSISANTSEDTKRLVTQTIQQAQPALTQAAKASIMNDRRRGGQMKSVFG